MQFNSFAFFIFLAVALFVFYVSNERYRKTVFLFASYLFYSLWDWRFCGLLFAVTAIDFFAGAQIQKSDNPTRRKRFLALSVVANLSILGFFKYYNFFIQSFSELFHLDANRFSLKIILPVGLSFFIFQSLSYTIDVYRKKVEPRKRFLDYALYVSCFPQLLAGPIIKAKEFFPLLDNWRKPDARKVQWALALIVLGLVKKIAFADNFALAGNAYFADPASHPGVMPAFCGVLAFSMQILFDFSGYTDVAIGVAGLFGLTYPDNFRRPYLSLSVTEFWHRWHISLSTWLRDYLYISLGGNRGGTFATYRNLMLTMLLGGLWHGASWNFVIWGGLHGLFLVLHKIYVQFATPKFSPKTLNHWLYQFAAWFLTMSFVGVCWVFFRSETFDKSMLIIENLFFKQGTHSEGISLPIIAIALLAVVLFFLEERYRVVQRLAFSHYAMRGIAFGVALIIIAVFAVSDVEIPFIYFKF
jgi:D-alanyl-lipoteichoic acid acyltransferase DltB (MBOAT superfamily)